MDILKTNSKNRKVKVISIIFTLFVLMVVLFVLNLTFGRENFSLSTIKNAIFYRDINNVEHTVIWKKFYKLIAMFLVISAFSIGGLLMQNVTKNALASPGVMGMTQAAKLGVSFASFYAVNISTVGVYVITMAASAIPLIILFLLMRFSKSKMSGLSMAFIGISLGVIMSSIEWFIMYNNHEGDLFIATFLNDTFGSLTKSKMILFGSIIGAAILISYSFSRRFTLLESGNELSNSVGSKTNITKLIAILMAVISVPAAMMLGGNLLFIGMIIPHIAKLLIRTKKYSILIPATIVIGAIVMFSTELISTAVYTYANKTINISAFVNVVAAPAFIVIARRVKV